MEKEKPWHWADKVPSIAHPYALDWQVCDEKKLGIYVGDDDGCWNYLCTPCYVERIRSLINMEGEFEAYANVRAVDISNIDYEEEETEFNHIQIEMKKTLDKKFVLQELLKAGVFINFAIPNAEDLMYGYIMQQLENYSFKALDMADLVIEGGEIETDD